MSQDNKRSITTVVSFPEFQAVDDHAERLGVSRSALIREAIREELARQGAPESILASFNNVMNGTGRPLKNYVQVGTYVPVDVADYIQAQQSGDLIRKAIRAFCKMDEKKVPSNE